MDPSFDLAKFTTPLSLAGFTAAAFFIVLRLILKTVRFQELNQRGTTTILLRIINLGFILALIAIILGYLGFTSRPNIRMHTVRLDPSQRDLPAVLRQCATQIGALLALGPGLQGPVPVSTETGTLKDVMDEICKVKSCRWWVQEGNPPVLVVNPLSNPARPEPSPQ